MTETRVESFNDIESTINNNRYLAAEDKMNLLLIEIAGSLAVIADASKEFAEKLEQLEQLEQPEIIKCGECIYCTHTIGGRLKYCTRHARYKPKDYFCGDAKRRTND